LIVNFSNALELLTKNLSQPICAPVHGVVKTTNIQRNKPDRIVCALSMESPAKLNLYQYDENKELVVVGTTEDFQRAEERKNYNDQTAYID